MKTSYFILVFFILSTLLYSTIINVPADQPTIQEGINVAVDTDTVLVQPGTYVENINYNGKLITVASLFLTTQDTTYISQTLIDGNQNGSVITFSGGEDTTAVLCGFTITNGLSSYAGGIYCLESSPSLVNITITGNVSFGGGGIACWDNSYPSLTNVTISGNSADSSGGGIYCTNNSSPILQNVTISDNSAGNDGGGIACWDNSNPSLINIMISDNSATFYGGIGGGISCWSNSNPSLENVTITGNSATGDYGAGGGIFCNDSCPSLINVTLSDNSAEFSGGGIYCIDNSSPILENITITGNSVYWSGGGIYCGSNSNPNLENVIITINSAGEGGGICCYDSSPNLENVTITCNSVSSGVSRSCCGGGIYCNDNSNPSLVDVAIVDNFASIGGGGIYCGFNSSPSLENVTIKNNEGAWFGGGGICCEENSSPSLVDVAIVGNTTIEDGGGIYCGVYSFPSLVNVTISDNYAFGDGGGIYCIDNSCPSLVNCILWNDSPQEISGSVAATYSDIQGGWEGEGNIDEDPLFVGIGDYPFSLQDLSPCVNAGIPDTTGMNLPEFDLAGNPRVYGGRIDMGAYENQNVVGANENLIPLITKLNQNYPNPFNPTTTIKYSLKENSKVSLNIYNIKGQKVKQLVSDQLSAGQHSVVWNGTDNNGKPVSSGIYFYKLKTENYEKTKRMILLK